jgi:hypothetical protein
MACKNFEILSEADLQVFVCRKLFDLFAVTPTLKVQIPSERRTFLQRTEVLSRYRDLPPPQQSYRPASYRN